MYQKSLKVSIPNDFVHPVSALSSTWPCLWRFFWTFPPLLAKLITPSSEHELCILYRNTLETTESVSLPEAILVQGRVKWRQNKEAGTLNTFRPGLRHTPAVGTGGITWTLCVPLFMSMEIITTTSFKVVVRPTEWVFLRKVSWAVPAAEWVSYGMIAVPGLLTWCPPSGTEDRLGRCGIQEWECP